MYALEPEPEQQGRWRRLGGGALVAVTLAAGVSYGADKFEPTRRLMEKVVKLTVMVETPKPPLPDKPLPPLPPPPKRLAPKQKTLAPKPKATEALKPPTNEPQQVGLDESSFGEGSGGPAFGVGNTAMGAPPTTFMPLAEKPKQPAPPQAAIAFREARPLRAFPREYNDRARRLGIQGLMVLEVDVDSLGRVTSVRLRQGLEPGLDQHAVRAMKRMAFAPATRGGRAIPSTRFVRIKYELQG